jgi:hypothetical protein
MSNAITISGSSYTVIGTVTNQADNRGVLDLQVLAYDKDPIGKDDFLGIGITNAAGGFTISFDDSKFSWLLDRSPDLYFIVEDGGLELLNTKDNVIVDATASTPDINLQVDISEDKLRQNINPTAVPGWIGGFEPSNLDDLPMLGNLDNIDKLQRQQKVLWPEFSWNSEPAEVDKKRCYQMFAPDISRLGYTNEGRIYSIICPQQGVCAPNIGSMNVEVTVTGNKGWADEKNRTLSAEMSVVGKIWFSPSATKNTLLKEIRTHFDKHNLPFPSTKANAIVIRTFNPGHPDQVAFPLTSDLSTDFPIPDFARHEEISWTKGHLGVEIGAIEKTGIEKVDDFNQMVLDIFNMAGGNMLQEGNILTWDVWFTAPELVDQEEWANHAEKWRLSLESDHGSPDGPGTVARYFDGTPFKPLEALLKEELPKVLAFIAKHL